MKFIDRLRNWTQPKPAPTFRVDATLDGQQPITVELHAHNETRARKSALGIVATRYPDSQILVTNVQEIKPAPHPH